MAIHAALGAVWSLSMRRMLPRTGDAPSERWPVCTATLTCSDRVQRGIGVVDEDGGSRDFVNVAWLRSFVGVTSQMAAIGDPIVA